MRQANPTLKISAVLMACSAMLSACGGGGGGNSGTLKQELTFDFPSQTTLATTPKLVATASSGLPVTYSSATPTVCTVSGDVVTPLIVGECKVTATQVGGSVGGSTYAPVSQSQLFNVTKHPQAITFALPTYQPVNTTLTLNGTSDSGLPLTYVSTDPTACTVSGNVLTTVTEFTVCGITASQPGDGTYLPASNVFRSLLVRSTPPPVPFASSYVTGGSAQSSWRPTYEVTHSTFEDGAITVGAGGNLAGWGWNKNDKLTYSFPNGDFVTSFVVQQTDVTNAPDWGKSASISAGVLAPGLQALDGSNDTTGLQIGVQTTMTFYMAQNHDWFRTGSATNAGVPMNVDLTLAKLTPKPDGSACKVQLHTAVTPTAETATKYTVTLAGLTIQESCGLSETNPLKLIQNYSVAGVAFSTNGNINVRFLDATGASYTTVLTLGAIAFE